MREAFCKMLGCSTNGRLLMSNSDDFGMCHAANVGTIRALAEGFATSATLLVLYPVICGGGLYMRQDDKLFVRLRHQIEMMGATMGRGRLQRTAACRRVVSAGGLASDLSSLPSRWPVESRRHP